MANIPVYGKLVNETREGIIADGGQVAVSGGRTIETVLPKVSGGDDTVVPSTLLTKAEYDALVTNGTVEHTRLYLIYEEDDEPTDEEEDEDES